MSKYLAIPYPDTFRREICARFNNIIGDEVQSVNLERGVFNYAIKKATALNIVKKWDNEYFVNIYLDHLRTIYTNIKDPDVLELLTANKIKAHELAFMTHQEMKPQKWSEMIEKKKIRDKNMYEPKMEASTDNFICRKCKKKRCTYYQLQTRSADEPMTTFVTCLDCGNRWKC